MKNEANVFHAYSALSVCLFLSCSLLFFNLTPGPPPLSTTFSPTLALWNAAWLYAAVLILMERLMENPKGRKLKENKRKRPSRSRPKRASKVDICLSLYSLNLKYPSRLLDSFRFLSVIFSGDDIWTLFVGFRDTVWTSASSILLVKIQTNEFSIENHSSPNARSMQNFDMFARLIIYFPFCFIELWNIL